MKNISIPLAIAWAMALQSCESSLINIPGDDRWRNCQIENAEWSCKRVNENTLQIKALLLNDAFDCQNESSRPIWVNVKNSDWTTPNYSFTLWWKVLNDNSDFAEVLPGSEIIGNIITKQNSTVEIRTLDTNNGQKKVLDTYTTNCDYTPPCAVACTATCFEITPNNHCQWTSIYSFDLCNKPTTFAWTLTLENGMEFWRYPNNGAHLPIKVYTKYWSQIIKSDTFTVVIEARPVVQLVWRFSMNVNPGEKLYIEIWTQNKITKWNVKLTLSSWGISQQIITPFNDKDCTR